MHAFRDILDKAKLLKTQVRATHAVILANGDASGTEQCFDQLAILHERLHQLSWYVENAFVTSTDPDNIKTVKDDTTFWLNCMEAATLSTCTETGRMHEELKAASAKVLEQLISRMCAGLLIFDNQHLHFYYMTHMREVLRIGGLEESHGSRVATALQRAKRCQRFR